MYYGHGGWIAIAVFAGLFALRAFSSQRRTGGPNSTRSFTDTGRNRSHGAAPPATYQQETSYQQDTTKTGDAPGWFTDPFGKHTQRYWSGTAWTEQVTDDGAPSTDPPPPHPELHGRA
jgi:hypothetical protein